MKRIKVRDGESIKYAVVDDADAPLVRQFDWHLNKGYAMAYVVGCRLLMHRLLMQRELNATTIPKAQVDHLNFNRLDNRRSNLAVVSRLDNTRRQRRRITNSSGYRGVAKRNLKNGKVRYVACLSSEYLGIFATPEEAHKVWLAAAKARNWPLPEMHYLVRDWRPSE